MPAGVFFVELLGHCRAGRDTKKPDNPARGKAGGLPSYDVISSCGVGVGAG